MLNKEDYEIYRKYKDLIDKVNESQTIIGFGGRERDELYGAYLHGHQPVNLRCQSCVFEMFRRIKVELDNYLHNEVPEEKTKPQKETKGVIAKIKSIKKKK